MKLNQCRLSGIFLTLSMVGFAAILGGCGQQNTQRDNVNATNAADAQARWQDLAPAEGTFTGTVLLAQTHQSFAMTVDLSRSTKPAPSAQSQDPSESVSVPVLTGDMSFPVLENLKKVDTNIQDYFDDLRNFSALTAPMGINVRANFLEGTFDGTNLTLPYSVSGSSGIYGELNGQLSGGNFTGKWLAEEPTSMVGTFSLVLTSGSGS
jgi:hypothetical protein